VPCAAAAPKDVTDGAVTCYFSYWFNGQQRAPGLHVDPLVVAQSCRAVALVDGNRGPETNATQTARATGVRAAETCQIPPDVVR